MKKNEPCAFALTPHPCLLFLIKPINGFWDRLWTLTISHGILVWHWQKKHFAQSHPSISLHPSHVAPPIKTIVSVQGVRMLQQAKLYILGNFGIKNVNIYFLGVTTT
jgi:hypothetical protein